MPTNASTYYLQPKGQSLWAYLQSCWKKRALVLLFARRDLKIKYAQSWLGISWTLLQPTASVLLYAFVFGSLFGSAASNSNYLLQLCTGVVGWSLFYYLAQQSSSVLLQQQTLIQKIAFPKLLLLLAKAWVALTDFLLALGVLILFLLLKSSWPTMHYFALPLAVAMLLLQGLCIGICFSVLSTRYRDLQHALQFLLHGLLWLSPVFYVQDQLHGPLAVLLHLNPLTESLSLFRWALLGGEEILLPYFGLRTAAVLLLLCWGVTTLKKIERTLCDVL